MATWSVHHDLGPGPGPCTSSSGVVRIKRWSTVSVRGGNPQACASQRYPGDEFQDLGKSGYWRRRQKQDWLRMQNQMDRRLVVKNRRRSVLSHCSLFRPAGSSHRRDQIGHQQGSSSTTWFRSTFTSSAPTGPANGVSRLVEDVHIVQGVGVTQRGTSSGRKGIIGAALLTAAVSLMLGIGMSMSMVGKHNLPVDSPVVSLIPHPSLTQIRTRLPGEGRTLRENSRPPEWPIYDRRSGEFGLDVEPALHSNTQSIQDVAYLVDLTLARAAAYNSVYEIPDPREWGCSVSDQAGLMSGPVVEHINSVLDALRYNTGTEVTLVTVEAIGNPSLSAKSFAQMLFSFWKMDTESDGNNILLFFVRSDGRLEVEVGRALEKTLRQTCLWGSEDGWLSSLTPGHYSALLRKGRQAEGLLLVIKNLARRVGETGGAPVYHPLFASHWGHRINLLDLTWLSLPLLLVGGNLLSSICFHGSRLRSARSVARQVHKVSCGRTSLWLLVLQVKETLHRWLGYSDVPTWVKDLQSGLEAPKLVCSSPCGKQ